MKQLYLPIVLAVLVVTPFVGVWIETLYLCVYSLDSGVTPFVGVWIETGDSGVN